MSDLTDECQTSWHHDEFIIEITEESDLSLDGGYTFENVTNIATLDVLQAKQLRDQLNTFLEGIL